VPGAAQAVNPPTCHSLGYDYPFFRIDGSTFARNVRWLELRQAKTPHPADPVNHPGDQYPNKYDSDPEYPFQLRVDRTQHASRTFTVHDYARDQFKVSFNQGERATATATYVEDHSGYSPTGGTLHVRCTRTISAKFKKPPRQRQPGGGGGGDDPED
jgi:hypothetical protein